jgi:hypothetical protein
VFRRGRNLQLVAERTAAPTPDVAVRAAALEAKEKELQAALATIRAAFAILGSRALVMTALLATIGAFAWALWDPSGLRLAAACLFAAMGFLPALWADFRR